MLLTLRLLCPPRRSEALRAEAAERHEERCVALTNKWAGEKLREAAVAEVKLQLAERALEDAERRGEEAARGAARAWQEAAGEKGAVLVATTRALRAAEETCSKLKLKDSHHQALAAAYQEVPGDISCCY